MSAMARPRCQVVSYSRGELYHLEKLSIERKEVDLRIMIRAHSSCMAKKIYASVSNRSSAVLAVLSSCKHSDIIPNSELVA